MNLTIIMNNLKLLLRHKIQTKHDLSFTFARVCHMRILSITAVTWTGVTARVIDTVSVCATSVCSPSTFINIYKKANSGFQN